MSTVELKLTERNLQQSSCPNNTCTGSTVENISITEYGIVDTTPCLKPKSRNASSKISSPTTSPRSRLSSISSVDTNSKKLTDFYLIPEMRAGYMSKKCQFMPTSWVKRYFWLQKGCLTNFYSNVDSINPLKIEERARTLIQLKDYKLIKDSKKQVLILAAPIRTKNIRENISLHIQNKRDYDEWEYAFNGHINYAKGIIPNQALNNITARESSSEGNNNSLWDYACKNVDGIAE